MKNDKSELKISLVIVAGGLGKRLKRKIPKALVRIKDVPIVVKTLKSLSFYSWKKIVITYPENYLDEFKKEMYSVEQYKNNIVFVKGGKERQESVYNALRVLEKTGTDLVFIHDAARPFVSEAMVKDLIDNYEYPGVVPAIKPSDTIIEDSKGILGKKLNRERLLLIQTPQLFDFKILLKCHNNKKEKIFTDDSSLVKDCGYDIKWINGDKNNIKITTEDDLLIAEIIFDRN